MRLFPKDNPNNSAMGELGSVYKVPDPSVSSKSKEKKSPTRRQSWKDTAQFFSQNTTLHGVRFITMDRPYTVQRLLWVSLFLTCTVCMGVQIVERIVHYYSYPTSVNVHVNFNKTLAFPAITICNQNAFRATAASEQGVYRLLEELFSNPLSVNESTLAQHGVLDLPMDTLYRMTSHKKEDLIVRCEWHDSECGPENFTEVLTDHGLCFSFNSDPHSQLWVNSAGAEYGLRLTLNVEQYEFMPGPHDAAGVKLLLHDKHESPKVAELGLAVPTGTHAYVGMQLFWIQNLGHPHGPCRSEESEFYDVYSPEMCRLAHMTRAMADMCGCRHFYMPSVNGLPPVCTLEQYLTCYLENIGQVKQEVREGVVCPVPCDFLIYDPTMSFGSTSVYARDRLLADTSMASLKGSLLKAREVTSRMDNLKFQHFLALEIAVRTKFRKLQEVLTGDVTSRIQAQRDNLYEIRERMSQVWERKKYLLEWQKYHVEKNFMRARNAMEERTMFYLMLGFQEFSFQIETRIRQMAEPPDNFTMSQDVRSSLYLDTMNTLMGRIDLAERAHANYTQLYQAYHNGTPIFRYKFQEEKRADNLLMTPKPLLRQSLFRTSYTRKYSSRVGKDILEIKKYLEFYSGLANTSFANWTVDEDDMYLANILFLNRGRRFYQSRSVFYVESVEYPQRVMVQKIEDLDRAWRGLGDDLRQLTSGVDTLLTSLAVLEQSIMARLQSLIEVAQVYIDQGSVTKMQVAKDLTSDDVYEGIHDMKNFFFALRSRGQEVYDGWTRLVLSTNQVWKAVLNDENLEEYCEAKNVVDFLRNYTVVAEETENNFTASRDAFDFRYSLGNLDSEFLQSLNLLMDDMRSYIQEAKLDSSFIRENFLQLDVFYREKSYEQITQQEAYDKFALFCDIGGSMGLFVGASVLTIYEVIDLLVQHIITSLACGRRLSLWLKSLTCQRAVTRTK
ncbi:uncharacterized protein LOC101857070 [Aplysia californica]|uniref:Uncharacterized protein LOC101857070 n=1 Tax=Aplysia californica TaxID=6500 RepID=A0ABM0K823_APLCA|nr:uncharacterized protein LOC101857070 [Aplysia californica]